MAGRLPNDWIDELCARLDIVDVVSQYVPLRQKGAKFWGLCPFHNEKTASFSVDPTEQFYYCFGCHKGGNVLHFVMDVERIEFMDAVRTLSERAHFPIPEDVGKGPASISSEKRAQIFAANLQAAHFFHDMLWRSEGSEVLSYLHGRGLDDRAIRHFGLGAAPRGGETLCRYLKDKGFDVDLLVEAGLCSKREGRVFDMFRERAIFPIINASGNVLGFGGRAMGNAQPKYLNTPDTPVFNKRHNLYAMNFVRKERNLDRLILVEGYMDVVALRKSGIQGVVATLGTALTEEQARIMKRLAKEVHVAYDGDEAGQKAIERALGIFETQDVTTRVLVFPEGQDPDDFIRNNGPEAFEKLRAMHPVDYRMQRAAQKYDLSREDDREAYLIECCGYLRKLKNPVELDRRIQKLAEEYGLNRETLLRQVGVPVANESPIRQVRHTNRANENRQSEEEKAQCALIALLAANRIPSEAVKAEDFDDPTYRNLAARLLAGGKVAQILGEVPEEERARTAAALSMHTLPQDRERALEFAQDCLSTIIRSRRKRELESTMERIKQEKDPENRIKLLEMFKQLSQELNETAD